MNDATTLLTRVEALVPIMQHRAADLDEAAAFPAQDVADLTAAGALLAPMPQSHGGCGLGTQPETAAEALALMTALGRGNLAVGRVMEAHVNALRLVVRYGEPNAVTSAARDAAAGHLFALWVTDPAEHALRLDETLKGGKQFCSAAGHATRAVVTATARDGSVHLAMAALDHGVTVGRLAGGMQGMRAAATGEMRFDGVAGLPFGAPGDYLREPDFSTGAWRTSAVTLGGLQALVAEAIRQLVARGRAGDPHQQARMGEAMIARETATLWMREAAWRAETADRDPAAAIAYVNFSRLAVERACLEAITLVQRSLGIAAFLRPNPIERLCRDLATYLRQPAADMVLTEAAAYGMQT